MRRMLIVAVVLAASLCICSCAFANAYGVITSWYPTQGIRIRAYSQIAWGQSGTVGNTAQGGPVDIFYYTGLGDGEYASGQLVDDLPNNTQVPYSAWTTSTGPGAGPYTASFRLTSGGSTLDGLNCGWTSY